MMMRTEIIYTNDKLYEIWNLIKRYEYSENIKKYFKVNNIYFDKKDYEIFSHISGSISQACEYFNLADKATLYTKPLLIYYGTVNLAHGVATLISGKILDIHNHGMTITDKNNIDTIGDLSCTFNNKNYGGIEAYAYIFENKKIDFDKIKKLSIKESLCSLPDMYFESKNCFPNDINCIPLDSINSQFGLIYKTTIPYKSIDEIRKAFDTIPNIYKKYNIQFVSNSDEISAVIVNRLDFKYNFEKTLSGRSFLRGGVLRDNERILIPQWIHYYSILYSLSFASRYLPYSWEPFVRNDKSGEKNVIEKFLTTSAYYIPLKFLEYIDKTLYLFETKYESKDMSEKLSNEDVSQMITNAIMENNIKNGKHD